MESIQPYLDYFAANPEWAIAVVFLIAFGEALLIIGLFVPSTAVLVGAGMLVGTGHLEFWPIFWATAIGAILGDQISYWAGRMFGDRLKTIWPLNRYQSLVVKGEDFVRRHGGKSIAIGRFVPGVKAVVPGVVGMLGMNQPFFIFVNVTSGLFWAVAHILPGMLLGQGLMLAGDLSGRLVIVILVLLGSIAVIGWLIRLLAAALLSPFARKSLHAMSERLKRLSARPLQRLGRTMSPDHPRSGRLLAFGMLAFLCAGLLINLFFGIVSRDNPSNLDLSVNTLMSELRSAPGDDLMVALTMMGDGWVIWAMCAAMALWLAMQRAWIPAFAVIAAVAGEQLVTFATKAAVARPRPAINEFAIEQLGSFPSAHAAMATIAFGMLALIAGHAMGRWSRALLISLAATMIVTISFTRLYLGVHWLSDVFGGIMLALILVAAIAFVLEAYPARRTRPLGLIGFSLVALTGAWFMNVSANFEAAEVRYAEPSKTVTFTADAWRSAAWLREPSRRIDLAGQPEDVFVAQWAGSIDKLSTSVVAAGFSPQETWTWKSALSYFDPSAELTAVPPRPLLHEGLKAKFTAVRADPGNANRRYVLRAYKTGAEIETPAGRVPVFLVSLLQEDNQPRFGLYTMPASNPAPLSMAADVLARLQQGGTELVVTGRVSPEQPQAVILAQP